MIKEGVAITANQIHYLRHLYTQGCPHYEALTLCESGT